MQKPAASFSAGPFSARHDLDIPEITLAAASCRQAIQQSTDPSNS